MCSGGGRRAVICCFCLSGLALPMVLVLYLIEYDIWPIIPKTIVAGIVLL